jgi:hypothetical protein
MSNFHWVWRYSCLNVKRKKPYKRYEGKANYLLIAFIGYVNDLSKLQQFKLGVQKPRHRLQCIFTSLDDSKCSSPEVVLAFLLYEGNTIHNASDQFASCIYVFFVDFAFHLSPQTKL